MELKDRLASFMPIRVILYRYEDAWVGLTEEHSSMSFSPTRVRVWHSGQIESIIGPIQCHGLWMADLEASKLDGAVILDPFDPECPIDIDWEFWLKAMTHQRIRQYDSRNVPFQLNNHIFTLKDPRDLH